MRITFVCIKVFGKVFTLSVLHGVIGLISWIFKLFPNQRVNNIIVDVALFFRKSLLCISCSSSLVIQGERLFLTLFFLNGACLSITLAKFPERKRMNVVSFTWKCQKIQFFFIWAGFSFIFARPVALLAVTVYWAFHRWYITFTSTEIF